MNLLRQDHKVTRSAKSITLAILNDVRKSFIILEQNRFMDNFIKQNWFKVGLIALILIAILVYLLSWQPTQKREKELANNIRCQQEGSQLYEKQKESLLRNDIYLDPEFRFSKELNTCLLKGAIIGADDTGSSSTFFIKDVYSNQELASYSSYNIKGQEPSMYGDREKYELLKEKYFSNQ